MGGSSEISALRSSQQVKLSWTTGAWRSWLRRSGFQLRIGMSLGVTRGSPQTRHDFHVPVTRRFPEFHVPAQKPLLPISPVAWCGRPDLNRHGEAFEGRFSSSSRTEVHTQNCSSSPVPVRLERNPLTTLLSLLCTYADHRATGKEWGLQLHG